ncbi:MAG: DUF190 domain-containing protein [Planctomycetes bacterium]|nr:DUF190 domain-containing protein [Planctomycetota bacterium]MBI3846113.1 DUF190 domain-containing protein [Planctomycetota bacterium]
MKFQGENELLRVYVDSSKRSHGQPVYERIVLEAHAAGCRGATALRGVTGFGAAGRALHAHALSLTERVPVIVEMVDEPARIGALLTRLAPVLGDLLVTRERAFVVRYRHREADDVGAPKFEAKEDPAMLTNGEGVLLRVFIGDSDRWQGQPLFEAIVRRARELGLAGATVLHGPMGFGAHSRIHTAKVLQLSQDLPVVIEIVDTDDRIQQLLATLDQMIPEGLVTLEKVRIVKYAHREK